MEKKEIAKLVDQCFETLNNEEIVKLFFMIATRCSLAEVIENLHLVNTLQLEVLEAVEVHNLNTTQLLEIYSNDWIEHDGKFSILIDARKRRLFIEKLATYMFLNDRQPGMNSNELICHRVFR